MAPDAPVAIARQNWNLRLNSASLLRLAVMKVHAETLQAGCQRRIWALVGR